jgi:hypothetical protein
MQLLVSDSSALAEIPLTQRRLLAKSLESYFDTIADSHGFHEIRHLTASILHKKGNYPGDTQARKSEHDGAVYP